MKIITAFFAMLFLSTISIVAYAEVHATDPASQLFALVEALVIPVTGVVSMYLFAGIKSVASFIGDLPANVQRILVVVVTWAIGWVSSLINVALPDTLAAFDIGSVETAVAAAFAMLIHSVSKRA